MSGDWRPTGSRQALRLRAQVVQTLRAFFERRGSLEVETPVIVPSPGVDAWLDAPSVTLDGHRAYLSTSPEYAMKRLLASGSGSIHQLGPAFRAGERGRLHEPQFTMLEWYEVDATDVECMDTTEALVRAAAAVGDGRLRFEREVCDASADAPPFRRVSFDEVFEDATGTSARDPDTTRLGRLLRVSGVRSPPECTAEELVDLALGAVVQPELGLDVPTFVTDWPTDRAGLARIRPGKDGEPSAARFELYACGVELCNGYHELADPVEQRARIDAENDRRAAAGKDRYPVDEQFLAALASGLPDCAGNALGVDRLVMLIGGLKTLLQARSFAVRTADDAVPARIDNPGGSS
ncbi:MAG: EF-P lysine aminoacylase GenX [Deltaproteobacteria bacterium]|nr:EF-P lysine aminoacylase GenX [Deltaproteobacteria bacterium]